MLKRCVNKTGLLLAWSKFALSQTILLLSATMILYFEVESSRERTVEVGKKGLLGSDLKITTSWRCWNTGCLIQLLGTYSQNFLMILSIVSPIPHRGSANLALPTKAARATNTPRSLSQLTGQEAEYSLLQWCKLIYDSKLDVILNGCTWCIWGKWSSQITALYGLM